MIAELDRFKHAFANGDRAQQRRGWEVLSNHIDSIYERIGQLPPRFLDVPGTGPAHIPPTAEFAVAGVDGKFLITIVNPQNVLPVSPAIQLAQVRAGLNVKLAAIYHNLQSSRDVNFDNTSGVTDYGASQQLGYEFQDPNVIKFWRLRSSFDGKNWNPWQIYSSPLTCGPVGVASGLLRTASLTQVNGAGTPTTQPLGSTSGIPVNQATISIASFQVQYPAPIGLLTYNSGAITPLLDNTKYYVYCLDPTYAGGVQTYIASLNNPDVTALDAVVFLGIITTPVHGGGGTSGAGGGNGPCFTENTLVITRDGIKCISRIGPGDEVLTQRGWRRVLARLEHDYDGPLNRMPDGGRVTPDHRFYCERRWLKASQLFLFAGGYAGKVFNLSIEGDGSDDEQCYTLANGHIAHNVFKQ